MKHLFKVIAVSGLLVFGTLAAEVSADGTESLGDPSVTIAAGTGIVTAGTGLLTDGTGTINISVPHPVVQALLYWQRHSDDAGDVDETDTLEVNGMTIEGTRIGGPTLFFSNIQFAAYRADITSDGLVAVGDNVLNITGVPFPSDVGDGHDGAGLLVVYDDGSSPSDIQVRDGLDMAFCGFGGDLNVAVPQTFSFDAASEVRQGTLSMFYGSIAEARGSTVNVVINGVIVDQVVNGLGNTDGPEWDTLTRTFDIPADATAATVEVLSTGGAPFCASLSWVGAGLSVPPGPTCGDNNLDPGEICDGTADDACPGQCQPDCTCPPTGGEGCTPGYWKSRRHLDSWTGAAPGDNFNATFGTAAIFDAEACSRPDRTPSDDPTLLKALYCRGGELEALARHAVAALLNSLHPEVNSGFTTAQVISLVQTAIASGDAWQIESAKNQLEYDNEMGCPLN